MIYPQHFIVKALRTCGTTSRILGNPVLLLALRGFERHITSGALHLLRELHFDCSPHLDSIRIFGVDAMDSAADFRPLVHFDYTDQVGIVSIVPFRDGAGWAYGDGCEGGELAVAFQFHPFHIAPIAFDTYRVRRQI